MSKIITESEQRSFSGQQGVFHHESDVLNCQMQFSVYVPDVAQRQPCPVLYYLSGLTCTQENVTTKGGFQKYASELGLVVVCPDTSPRGTDYPGEHDSYDFGSGAGFYVNATESPWSKSYRMYDYVVEELPKLIEEHFPIDASRCGIFGHSMGGHGALTIGLRNPQKFQSVSAFAPIVAPTQCPWGQKAFNSYLGSNPEAWNQYDASQLVLAGHSSLNKILIDQGTDDQFLESQLKPSIFENACKSKKQPMKLRLQPGFDHSYYLMNTFMEDHIRFHSDNLNSTR